MNALKNAMKTVEQMNGEIIAFAPEHGDTGIYTVFAVFEQKREYTVYNYNAEFNGLFAGYYTMMYDLARDEFVRRMMTK
jgi:1,2-phenylacetyl-CoA epoxidase PaaB subunit